jgi:hypothetical protein
MFVFRPDWEIFVSEMLRHSPNSVNLEQICTPEEEVRRAVWTLKPEDREG